MFRSISPSTVPESRPLNPLPRPPADAHPRRFAPHLLALAAIFAAAPAAFGRAPIIHRLEALPGGTGATPYQLSADGRTLVGSGSAPNSSGTGTDPRPVRWSSASGLVDLGGVGSATGISRDASTIVGALNVGNAYHAHRWTSAGVQDLGVLPGDDASFASRTNADGTVVIGDSRDPQDVFRPFRWTTSAGMQALPLPAGATTARAHAVSADGNTVIGRSDAGAGEEAFLWTAATGSVSLVNGAGTYASDLSDDASIIVGATFFAGQVEAARWTAGSGWTSLGLPAGALLSVATGISGDGSTIYGISVASIGQTPFVYTQSLGLIDLTTHLANLGVDTSGWQFEQITSASSDGSILSGWGSYNGEFAGWVLEVPTPGAITLLALGALPMLRRRR